jgi:hypothetical protein
MTKISLFIGIVDGGKVEVSTSIVLDRWEFGRQGIGVDVLAVMPEPSAAGSLGTMHTFSSCDLRIDNATDWIVSYFRFMRSLTYSFTASNAVPVLRPQGLLPASFRFRLAADTLPLGDCFPLSGRIRDFHPRVTAHAGRTNKIPPLLDAAREFVLRGLRVTG